MSDYSERVGAVARGYQAHFHQQMRERSQRDEAKAAEDDLRNVQRNLLRAGIQAAIDRAPDAFRSVTTDDLVAVCMARIEGR